MKLKEKLGVFVGKFLKPNPEIAPEKAYDLWAFQYDNQPGNLVLDLDEELFSRLLSETEITDKVIADIGCGTGRHWNQLVAGQPARMIGFDVSAGMLSMLRTKFPEAEIYRLTDYRLRPLADQTCDLLISTLAMAHISNIGEALAEWTRVLRPGGHMILTDYHPETLARGGSRTFKVKNRVRTVQSYLHPVEKIKELTRQLGLDLVRFAEREIDEQVKHYYEQQNAMAVYERFQGVPVIYGIHLKKAG